jgi:ubiquinol-cytochrome c reductase cytochrome b subunit
MYLGEDRVDGVNLNVGESHIGSGNIRRESFLRHIRPGSYKAPAVAFKNTWFMGFFCVFLLVLACVTGAILMVYYAPSPTEAYGSIIRLETEVPFGSLMRDLHRLGGELMIITVVLHMLRVFVAGAHNRKRSFTWITGIMLLLCTLMLAFSGYLLPWDQLAFWGVTIATSMAETIPLIGDNLTLFLRGGPEFGSDGLLRFYLLHIIVLPTMMFLFLGIHYYRVARLHGISLPNNSGKVEKTVQTEGWLRFFPNVLLFELLLSLASLLVLIGVATFFYDAPLEHHAAPNHTPLQTRAPWFFLWLQGGLKLGDTFIMGICFPVLLLCLLLFLPYIDRGSRRSFFKRPIAVMGTLLLAGGLTILTFLGMPNYGVENSCLTDLFMKIDPEDKESPLHGIGYDNLIQGIYETTIQYDALPKELNSWLLEFSKDVEKLSKPQTIMDPVGVVIIQQWQANLKRVVVRIKWMENTRNGESAHPKTSEATIYVHHNSTGRGVDGNEAGGKS